MRKRDQQGRAYLWRLDGDKGCPETEKGSKTKTCACGFTVAEDILATGGNKPTDDEDGGLGTDAIVAIVIGSAVVAGVGGFAIWWFVISKRTLAQLGSACKGAAQKVKGFFTKKK